MRTHLPCQFNLHALLHLPVSIYCTTPEDLKHSESCVGVSTHVEFHFQNMWKETHVYTQCAREVTGLTLFLSAVLIGKIVYGSDR